MTMIEKLKSLCLNNDKRIFYQNKDECITYGELLKKALFYAELLQKQGTTPIIIYGGKEVYVVVSIIACLIANRPYVPVDLFTPDERLKQIIDLTNSSLIISQEKIKADDVNCLSLEELVKFKNCKKKDTSLNSIAYIIFTSGSTGVPKGVPISYNNLMNFISWISNLVVLKDFKHIKVLNQASFSFDLSVADFYYSLFNGHTVVSLDDLKDYNGILNTIKNEDINLSVITPTFAKLLLLEKEFNSKNYKELKCIYFCGEQLEVKLVKELFYRFPKIHIINAYGPTEATSAVSAVKITPKMLKHQLLPVGVIENFATDIDIINNEIVLSGKSVFSGYLNENNHDYFFNQNNKLYYKTKDSGYYKDGYLFCKGRLDNQIKYKGYRIELDDIKLNIDKINGVKDSVVIAKYDGTNVKRIKAFIIFDGDFSEQYLKKELSKRLPYYMIPNSFYEIEKLPVTKNGKIDKRALLDERQVKY